MEFVYLCPMKHILSFFFFVVSIVCGLSAEFRTVYYRPDGRGLVCENGNNRYTRALYGSHSNWRLETSDRPIFASFDKKIAWNIQFSLLLGQKIFRLDSTSYCRAYYEGGMRQYVLRDARWGNGEIRIDVLAEHEGEHAIWRFEACGFSATQLHKIGPFKFIALRQDIANHKMSRNGDLGIDARDYFEARKDCPDSLSQKLEWNAEGVSYLRLVDNKYLEVLPPSSAGKHFATELEVLRCMTTQLDFQTPDPLINTLGPTLMAAADGLWDGETWLHGCIGWRTPLAGWRGGYIGDIVGWQDRAMKHFLAYQASMVTDIEPVVSPPAQDTAKNLARSAEKWGTPMYSNGYICKLPNNDRKMSHYDMNLNYVDELLWHFQFDADPVAIRAFWPTLKLHLEWEKRNWDPDGDHLYDGYCCIWASDALYYNSGAVTHSSAYNYRGNLLAAHIAELIGEDPVPYQQEAEAILEAMNQRLWIPSMPNAVGHWAEFQDFMGLKRLHPEAALWSIYTPIDCGACSPEQAYEATRWVDTHIPHIPMGFADASLYTLSTTSWMPYAWSTNNVAHEEVANMALAYFLAGRRETGYRLLYSDLLDEMCAGACPGNFGQISYYDKARKEAYRDFGDNIGITSRAIVQGLFGIRPDALYGRCFLQPGFPQSWDSVRVSTPYLSYRFHRENGQDVYDIEQHFAQPLTVILRLPIGEGRFVETIGNNSTHQRIAVPTSVTASYRDVATHYSVPQLDEVALGLGSITDDATARHYYVPMGQSFNAQVDDIFRQSYLSPRSPYTTLQIPVNGIGDWCEPNKTAVIDDAGFRGKISEDGLFDTGLGLKFQSPRSGKNVLYASLWDNYPDSVQVACPVSGKYDCAYLLLVGSTNNMQSRIENGVVVAHYSDGSADTLSLVNPYNWCPVEQDYFYDDHAFWSTSQHPYRVHLGSGLVSRTLWQDLHSQGVNAGVTSKLNPFASEMQIPSGAGQILKMPLDAARNLQSISITVKSNDILIGVMAITLENR